MQNAEKLKQICKLIRYDILTSTTAAGSGHPSSSLSAVELMTTLFFDGFLSYSIQDPSFIFNDRVVFSKGHAAPLLYSLYHAAGVISYEELMTLRKFDSVLEGHPTPRFKMIDVSTGSLGQGLSVGIGMALGIKLKVTRVPKVFVLLGDSEMAEGQIWEAMQLASHYKLNNLVGILDVNRLGQRGETMLEWDLKTYEKRIKSFGWNTIVVDGHDLKKVQKAFTLACSNNLPPTDAVGRPTMIIAKTIKGKGVSFMENKDGWHGKPVPKDMLKTALKELGKIDLNIRGKITLPKFQITNNKSQTNSKLQNSINNQMFHVTSYKLQDLVATREAYGNALVHLGTNENIVVLDGETSNSTYAEKFKKIYPNRFFEMYIAEQNMISVALGFSKIGYIPFSSSFAAFLTRAFDQMRIAQYSKPNIKICGSHAGVSIGEDGPSQMALEDLAMVRSILESVVFYPSDAISTEKIIQLMYQQNGLYYIRTTREKTPILYSNNEKFEIGGSKIHKVVGVGRDRPVKALIIAAGITLHEALKAQKKLAEEKINTIVMDCYSVKPIDVQSINRLAKQTKNIIVVEDHYPAGGIGEAVLSSLLSINYHPSSDSSFTHLCVHKLPRSGKLAELLRYEEIDAEAIIKTVKNLH